MRVSNILVFLTVLILIIGCTKFNKIENVIYDKTLVDEYYMDFFDVDTDLSEPMGITVLGDDIIVVDSNNHRLLRIDENGEVLQIIGKAGHGHGEFLKPTAVVTDKENQIYVADSGNSRIQKFNKQGEFVLAWELPVLKDLMSFERIDDLAIDSNNNLYISVFSPNPQKSRIHIVDSKGNITSIGKKLIGHLEVDHNRVIIATSLEVKSDTELESGNHFIHIFENEKIISSKKLPHGYNPADIVAYNNELYIFSKGYQQLDRFNLEGEYINTVWEKETSMETKSSSALGMYSMALSSEGHIYITNRLENKIYRFIKN